MEGEAWSAECGIKAGSRESNGGADGENSLRRGGECRGGAEVIGFSFE